MRARQRRKNLTAKVSRRKKREVLLRKSITLLNLIRRVNMFKSCDFVQTVLKFVFILNM